MKITKRRTGGFPKSYAINVDGEQIGSAHGSNAGAGWYARGEGVPIRNSWALGLKYETIEEAATAAIEYVKGCLRPVP